MSTVVRLSEDETTASEWINTLKGYALETSVFFVEGHIDVVGIEEWLQRLPDPPESEQVEELRTLIYSIKARADMMPGRQLAYSLRTSLSADIEKVEWMDTRLPPSSEDSPSWSTGCVPIDNVARGHGMSVIAGAPKAGKSLLALSSAIEAALSDDWKVVYINAEMTANGIMKRMSNYLGGKFDDRIHDNLFIANVYPGITPSDMCDQIVEHAIDDESDRLLIVLDSINRLASFATSAEDGESYWTAIDSWQRWGLISRRISEGAISWLMVSELNSRNEVKGQNLVYTADYVVRLTQTEAQDVVQIDVPYAREKPAIDVGPCFRDFASGRFVQHGASIGPAWVHE